ncbi:thialysine N-epsilon-acetyltransferase-like isoform X2 [Mytilus galloprovincialis]|uniref:thialysine N-epsilon-acetyltransferase-like isoform X2 n=1 Tax=Mytilus galloprovincialis TaxID=29158 RepID=UPI003F7BB003
MEDTVYTVRPANYEDCEAIMSLVMELAAHVKCEHEVKIKVDNMVGYLLYYYTYSPWVGKTVYMEDFYVKPEHRKKGIGTYLLKTAVKVFLETQCSCMEWAVPCWNKVAVDYYKQKGAINLTETEQLHIYRLTEEAMENLLTK